MRQTSQERRERMLLLRLQGFTQREVGLSEGISQARATQLLYTQLRRMKHPNNSAWQWSAYIAMSDEFAALRGDIPRLTTER